jgi:hypothetical protein
MPATRRGRELDHDAWLAVRKALTPSQRKAFHAYQERMDVLISRMTLAPEVISENSHIARFVGELCKLIKAIPWLSRKDGAMGKPPTRPKEARRPASGCPDRTCRENHG